MLKGFKKLVSLVLVLAVSMVVSVPAFAEEVEYQWPTSSTTINQPFKKNGAHNGIDIGATKRDSRGKGIAGDEIYAFADGTVNRYAYGKNKSSSYGVVVYLNHINPKQSISKYLQTRYAHMMNENTPVNDLSTGVSVDMGQYLGQMGTTGQSTGVHLHFETRKANSTPTQSNSTSTPINPIGNYFTDSGEINSLIANDTKFIRFKYVFDSTDVDRYVAPKDGIQ